MPPETPLPKNDVVELRMKIGAREFEAKGPRDAVAAHVETWSRLAGLSAPPVAAPH
jgi:hypothetical protein